jgi:hypothetical protein
MTVGLLTVLLAEFALKLQNTEPSTVSTLRRQVQHQQCEVLPSSARSDGCRVDSLPAVGQSGETEGLPSGGHRSLQGRDRLLHS